MGVPPFVAGNPLYEFAFLVTEIFIDPSWNSFALGRSRHVLTQIGSDRRRRNQAAVDDN